MVPGPLILALSLAVGEPAPEAGWRAELERWRQEREAALRADDGWLSVAGLFWLPEGGTAFGSGMEAPVRLRPPVPQIAGRLIRTGESVRATLAPGVDAGLGPPGPDGMHALRTDADGDPTWLRFGEQRFHVIRRGERLGVRLIDDAAPNRVRFEGLRWFPPDPAWRIRARWVAHEEPRALRVPTVTGRVREQESPGYAVFEAGGRRIRLHPVLSGSGGDERLFFVFRDATSGRETYGAGRFLYAALPEGGAVELDFNRAYTPPCAFTLYATCPLPPRENRLEVAIEAGEKDPKLLH